MFNGREYTLRGGDCMIIQQRGGMMRDIVPSSNFRVEIVYVSEAFVAVCTPQSNYGMRGGQTRHAPRRGAAARLRPLLKAASTPLYVLH